MITDDKLLAERSTIEAEAFKAIAVCNKADRSHERAKVELGRIFRRLKKNVGHGEFEDYYGRVFGESGVSLRTARRYMKLAKEAEARSKTVSLTVLKSGTDENAVTITNATRQAQEVVEQAQKPEPPYRLALRLLPAVRDALIRYWASPHRSSTELKIVNLLVRDLVKQEYLEPFRFPRYATENTRPEEKIA